MTMHAIIRDGAPVELTPGLPFTGPDGVQHPGNALELWSADELAAAGVRSVTDDAIPAGKVTTGSTLAIVNGAVVRHWTLADAPEPVIRIFKADIWRRATDAEAAAMDAALEAATVKQRRIYSAAQELRSDDDLFGLLEATMVALFGEARAAALLAPSA